MDPAKLAKLQAQAAANRIGEPTSLKNDLLRGELNIASLL